MSWTKPQGGSCRCHERNCTVDGHTPSLSLAVKACREGGRGHTKHGFSKDASLVVLEVCVGEEAAGVCVIGASNETYVISDRI